MSDPTVHQDFQAFPKLDSRLINEDGTVSEPWYKLFINMWRKTGGSTSSQTSVIVLGPLAASFIPGPRVVETLVGPSPFVFAAPSAGVLTVFGGKCEMARNGAFTEVSLTGGAFFLAPGDQLRVSWATDPPAPVVFYPLSISVATA